MSLNIQFDVNNNEFNKPDTVTVHLDIYGPNWSKPAYSIAETIEDSDDIDVLFDTMERLGDRFLRFIGAE